MQKKAFLGVYSTTFKDLKGSQRKRLFFAWSVEKGYEVQQLDSAFKPVDSILNVDSATFVAQYIHEPSILAVPLRKSDARQDVSEPSQGPAPASSDSAEVEKTLREHFRKAMLRFKRKSEKDAALNSLRTLTEVEEGIQPQHKHMFADFGIGLRKSKEFDLALACCRRVLMLAPDDDHAHFNTARVLMEMGNIDDAERHLLAAMDMAVDAPKDLRLYQQMLGYLGTERRRRQRPGKR